jgi:hypothetical protein
MSPIRALDAAELHRIAFAHVEATGHRLICSDHQPDVAAALEPEMGIKCCDCEVLWVGPYPGNEERRPGVVKLVSNRHLDWPYDSPHIEKMHLRWFREEYLSVGCQVALARRVYGPKPTLWEHVRDEFLEFA